MSRSRRVKVSYLLGGRELRVVGPYNRGARVKVGGKECVVKRVVRKRNWDARRAAPVIRITAHLEVLPSE